MDDNIYLSNTYGFIRHGVRVVLYAWYEKLLPVMIVLDAMITYDRSIGTRDAFVQEAATFESFSDPRFGSAGSARGAPARQGSSGRHLHVLNTPIRRLDPRVRPASDPYLAGHDPTREI